MDDLYEVEVDMDDELDDEFTKDDLDREVRMIVVNKTIPVMSIFEKSKIISCRCHQLNKGYKTNIPEEVESKFLVSSFDISIEEFKLNKLPPYILKRVYPDGRYENWKHNDFKYFPDEVSQKYIP
jgi:DNA-directed RNA polymerase subunit K/omega